MLQFATPSQLYREPADETVARFIGEGMVVPVDVRDVSSGSCVAVVFGHGVRMRCRAGQRVGAATACIRAEALRVVQRAAGGFAARVLRMTYEGGRFRLDTIVETTKQVLHLHRPEPCAFAAGDALRLDVADGWVIPTEAQ